MRPSTELRTFGRALQLTVLALVALTVALLLPDFMSRGYGNWGYGGWGMMGPWMMGGMFFMWLIPVGFLMLILVPGFIVDECFDTLGQPTRAIRWLTIVAATVASLGTVLALLLTWK